MAFSDQATAKWNELKQKLQDKGNQERVKAEIKKRLKQGKEAIDRIERELRSPENRQKAKAKIQEGLAKVEKLKKEFRKRERQAVAYTRKSPERALVVAAAAGALAGAVWVALRRKK